MKQNKLQYGKTTFALFLILSAISFKAGAQQMISLQKAVDLTLANNLTVRQSQITAEVATEDYKQSKYNMLPTASANPSAGYGFGRSPVSGAYVYANQTIFNVNATGSVQVTLFQGGQLRNQILQNKLLLDVDKTGTAKVKNDLILSVVTDYLVILADQDLVIAAKQQIDLAHITLDRAQKNFDQGAATLADLSQAKSQVSTAELNLTTAQNQVDLAVLILKQYMEMNPATDIAVEKPDISKLTNLNPNYDANEVIRTALTVNPDIKLAELQQETSEQAIRVAKGNYYPTVALYGALNSYYSSASQPFKVTGLTPPAYQQIGTVSATGQPVQSVQPLQQPIYGYYSFPNQFKDFFSQQVGINIQIPIFNRFTARTSVRKAKLNYENAQVATLLAKNTLSKTIIQAELDLHAAEKSYQSALQTYQSNKEALNVTKQRYDAGFVNTLDYNTAVTNYNKSQNDMINAQYTMVFRSKVIDYYLGIPITL